MVTPSTEPGQPAATEAVRRPGGRGPRPEPRLTEPVRFAPAEDPAGPAAGRAPRVRRVRPEQTSDDTDRGWGERPDEDSHDRWLQEQRPPHWE